MNKLVRSKMRKTLSLHKDAIDKLHTMWNDDKVLFYGNHIPEKSKGSVFLYGPTSRDGIPEYMWRKDAIFFLRRYGFSGTIFVPEYRGQSFLSDPDSLEHDFTDSRTIYKWERDAGQAAEFKLFWIPRNTEQLLGLTTNREIGQWMGRAEKDDSINNNLFIGWPSNASKMGSLQYELQESKVGYLQGEYFASLKVLCKTLAIDVNI